MNENKIRTMIGVVTANIILFIIEDTFISTAEAMNEFYNSEVFDRLCDIETGLYRESSGYVYDLYQIEKEHGRLVQLEI